MLNQVILVGKVVSLQPQNKNLILILEVERPTTTKKTDRIPCVLRSEFMSTNVMEYVEIGFLVGVKARLEQLEDSDIIEVVIEKITFINSGKSKEE